MRPRRCLVTDFKLPMPDKLVFVAGPHTKTRGRNSCQRKALLSLSASVRVLNLPNAAKSSVHGSSPRSAAVPILTGTIHCQYWLFVGNYQLLRPLTSCTANVFQRVFKVVQEPDCSIGKKAARERTNTPHICHCYVVAKPYAVILRHGLPPNNALVA